MGSGMPGNGLCSEPGHSSRSFAMEIASLGDQVAEKTLVGDLCWRYVDIDMSWSDTAHHLEFI